MAATSFLEKYVKFFKSQVVGWSLFVLQLQEVIDIVSSQLTTQLSPSARDILSDDLVHFLEHLLPIGEAISSDLSKTASHLKRIAYPGAHQDTHTKAPNLTCFMQTRRKDLASARETLSESRLKLAMAASSVLELHRGIVEVAIRALEQTKYGSIARGIKAQTEHLAIVAESMDAKLQYGAYFTARSHARPRNEYRC